MPEPNPSYDVAIAIYGSQIGGVARWRAVGHIAVGVIWVDLLGTFLSILLRQQSFDRDLGEPRVGIVMLKVGVGQLHGFDFLMEFRDAEWTVSRGLCSFHDVEHFECSHALAVGRKFVDSPVTVFS